MRGQLSTRTARIFMLLLLVQLVMLIVMGGYLYAYLVAIRDILVVMIDITSGGIGG